MFHSCALWFLLEKAEAGKSKSMAKSEVKADGTSDSIEVADAEEPVRIFSL